MPDTPFTTFDNSIQESTTLVSYAKVLLGRKKLPLQNSAPRRIVIFPIGGTAKAPADRRSVIDEMPILAAHIWGRDYDDVQDLTARFFQALAEQANLMDEDDNPIGFFWKYDPGTFEWDTSPDASEQGEVKVVQFSIVLALNRVALSTGTVEAVQIEGTPDVGTINILPDP